MRRSIALGLAFLCLGIMASVELRGAPPNDQCSGAEIIPGGGPFPYVSSITTNMHEATVVGDPPPPTNCYAGAISKSVWYAFTPALGGLYTISVKFTATTVADTLMGIYTSPNGCSGSFTQFVCNDDVGALQSAVTTNFNAGTTYYVVVWHTGTNALPAGERSVQLKVVQVMPPLNDACSFAAEIPSSASFPYWTTPTNTHLATTSGDPPGALCSNARRSVWYKFAPTSGGYYIIATCTNNTATTIYNTVLAVYQSTGGCGGTLTQLNCNNGFCGSSAAIIMNLDPQTEYYFVVWDYEDEPLADETDVQLFLDRQGPPLVTTIGHSNAQPTSVHLIGAANPRGLITRGYFEWGTTSNVYNNITAPSSTLGAGIVDSRYSRALLNLTPGTTVYYRAVATNSLGTVRGEGKNVTLPLQIDSVVMEGNDLRILFRGSDSYNYEVQYSGDLKTWTRLGDAIPLDPDHFQYIDAGARSQPQRFYRIKLSN